MSMHLSVVDDNSAERDFLLAVRARARRPNERMAVCSTRSWDYWIRTAFPDSGSSCAFGSPARSVRPLQDGRAITGGSLLALGAKGSPHLGVDIESSGGYAV